MSIIISRKLLVSAFAAGLIVVGGFLFAEVRPADALQDRIGFVDKLLNDSSAARQIIESDVEAAKELRGQAIEQYAAALQAHKSGDFEAAEAGLSEAIRLIYAAVSAAQQSGVTNEKSDRDFENRRASIEALLAAHQRISKEKGQHKEHDLLRQEIAAEVGIATALLEAGESGQARRHLDAAYDKVRVVVIQLREGDTLIRELNFETEEEEYLYELDRNDTHEMLVKVLLQERLEDERVKARVMSLISTAEELRTTAESQAKDGRFTEAIETLEQSTKELVKAIRGAGVYIPG